MTRKTNQAITIVSVLGVLLSAYAFYVELKLEANPNYVAACDIGPKMSCTRVLKSPYSKIYGMLTGGEDRKNTAALQREMDQLPLAVFGLVFFCQVIVLAQFDTKFAAKLLLILSSMNVIATCWMGYILFYILQDICVVCCSTYVLNGLVAVLTIAKNVMLSKQSAQRVASASTGSRKKKN